MKRLALIIGLIVVGLVLVAVFVSWKAALVAGGVALVGLVLYLRSLSGAMKDGIRRSKAGVLRGATVQVHAVRSAVAEGGVPRYEVELTLTPRPGPAQVRLWEPNQLRLSGAAKADVVRVHVREGREFTPALGKMVKGGQRLRLLAEWSGQPTSLSLQYYEDEVCEVPLKS